MALIKKSALVLFFLISLITVTSFSPAEPKAITFSEQIFEPDYSIYTQLAENISYTQATEACQAELAPLGDHKSTVSVQIPNNFKNTGTFQVLIYPTLPVLSHNVVYYAKFEPGSTTVYTTNEYSQVFLLSGEKKEEIIKLALQNYKATSYTATFQLETNKDQAILVSQSCIPAN